MFQHHIPSYTTLKQRSDRTLRAINRCKRKADNSFIEKASKKSKEASIHVSHDQDDSEVQIETQQRSRHNEDSDDEAHVTEIQHNEDSEDEVAEIQLNEDSEDEVTEIQLNEDSEDQVTEIQLNEDSEDEFATEIQGCNEDEVSMTEFHHCGNEALASTNENENIVIESEDDLMVQLYQSEYEVCELQFENEVLQSHNLELEKEAETWKENYYECFQSLEVYKTAYTNSLHSMFQLDVLRKTQQFGACFILNDDEKTQFYTGLPSYTVFQTLFTVLKPCAKKEITPKCSMIDEFFLTLTKLRLGLLHKDISYRMSVSEALVSKIFHKWIDLMYRELRQLITWPDRETLRENLPFCFRRHYINVVSIIDCFEIFIERPSSLEARAATYSQYKKHNTVKFLIGISPTGSISFLSKAWGGRVSDKVITQKSGFLDNICYRDVVMADRGFNIADDLAVRSACLEIPAYTRGKKQLSIAEVEKTRQLARVRIHVERVIGLLRNKYKILQDTLPISLIKRPTDKDVTTVDKLVTVAAALTNLSKPVL